MNILTFGVTMLGGLLAIWLLGGLLLRIGGLLLALAGGFGVALQHEASGVLVLAVGALLWLAGHWHYALRHHVNKSPLADYAFLRWAPEWLNPAREWAVAVEQGERVEGEPSDEGRGPA